MLQCPFINAGVMNSDGYLFMAIPIIKWRDLGS